MNRVFHKISNRIKARGLGKVISKFANKVGLVCFGYVDQNDDEHKVIRGFTVSASHIDNHYSVGTVGEYGVRLTNRIDTIYHGKQHITHDWMIMAIDLQTEKRIPHFLIGANNRDMKPFEALFSSFPNMHPMSACSLDERFSKEFTTRFAIYARPAKVVDVEKLFTVESTKIMAAHLWPVSVEQHDNVIYLYSINEKVTQHLLNTMLENGLWLADHLDKHAEILD